MAVPQAIDIRISMLRLAPQCFAFTSILHPGCDVINHKNATARVNVTGLIRVKPGFEPWSQCPCEGGGGGVRHTLQLFNETIVHLSIYTSECKALWGEPEHRYTYIDGLRKRHMILIRAHSYVTAADGPVCHLQFYWPLCFCYKHADA